MNAVRKFEQPECCARPSVTVMDWLRDVAEPHNIVRNRHCVRCGTHWHGPDGKVKQYTQAEWDAWVNDWRGDAP